MHANKRIGLLLVLRSSDRICKGIEHFFYFHVGCVAMRIVYDLVRFVRRVVKRLLD